MGNVCGSACVINVLLNQIEEIFLTRKKQTNSNNNNNKKEKRRKKGLMQIQRLQ